METNKKLIQYKMKRIIPVTLFAIFISGAYAQTSTMYQASSELKNIGISISEAIIRGENYVTSANLVDMITFPDYEENLKLESWMTTLEMWKTGNSLVRSALFEITFDTYEESLEIESWMLEVFTLGKDAEKREIERKLSPICEDDYPLESWMLEPNAWNK
ncbi:MAG: hypothetical protein ACLFUC_11345 [Bacteroidales bacterium]